MLVPMFGEHPIELGMSGKEKVLLSRLASDPRYPPMFHTAFPNDANPVSLGNITKAIVYEVTRRGDDIGAFKAPTLRNVAVRAPYMHDGSVKDPALSDPFKTETMRFRGDALQSVKGSKSRRRTRGGCPQACRRSSVGRAAVS